MLLSPFEKSSLFESVVLCLSDESTLGDILTQRSDSLRLVTDVRQGFTGGNELVSFFG